MELSLGCVTITESVTHLETPDSLFGVRSKGRLSQSKQVCHLAEEACDRLLLLDGGNAGRGRGSGDGREVGAVVAEVFLDERHDDLGEELDLPARLLEVVSSGEVVGRPEDLHGRRRRVEVHDQPVQEVVGEPVVRILGGPVAIGVAFGLVQVVALIQGFILVTDPKGQGYIHYSVTIHSTFIIFIIASSLLPEQKAAIIVMNKFLLGNITR